MYMYYDVLTPRVMKQLSLYHASLSMLAKLFFNNDCVVCFLYSVLLNNK